MDIEPSANVTGGPIGGTDPQGLEMINSLMDRVFDFVCRQSEVSIKEIIIFMKQVGFNLTSADGESAIRSFKDEDFERIL